MGFGLRFLFQFNVCRLAAHAEPSQMPQYPMESDEGTVAEKILVRGADSTELDCTQLPERRWEVAEQPS